MVLLAYFQRLSCGETFLAHFLANCEFFVWDINYCYFRLELSASFWERNTLLPHLVYFHGKFLNYYNSVDADKLSIYVISCVVRLSCMCYIYIYIYKHTYISNCRTNVSRLRDQNNYKYEKIINLRFSFKKYKEFGEHSYIYFEKNN